MIYVLLSAIFIYGMVRWGVPAIINVISWWSGAGNEVSEEAFKIPPQQPQLDPLPEATFSGKIKVSGTAVLAKEVELYVNGEKRDQQEVKEGEFNFSEVVLKEGVNNLEVVSKNKEGESQPTRSRVIRDQTEPEITINQPGTEAERFGPDEDQIEIRGTIGEEAKVFINEHLVFVDNEGNFEFTSDLKEGMNEFVIKAVDKAGNQTEKLVRVSYSR